MNLNSKKLLLISYYWPPSGGAGVQRWLKLSDYLIQLGWQVHVITVDANVASYPIIDETLIHEVNKNAIVHRTKTFEILNFYKKINNKKQIPYAGFANEGKTGVLQYVSRFIRGNFFIPDARIGWNKFALKKAEQVILQENISLVVTTSPPHSTQLIGLALKKKFNVKWIADLRDPWTDIYYYEKMNHTFIAKRIDLNYERNILENADSILVVSDFIKNQFARKTNKDIVSKITILPNGFDEKNFENVNAISYTKNQEFTISYNGTIASNYSIDSFIQAALLLINVDGIKDFKIQFTGSADLITKQKLESSFHKKVHFNSHVSHLESIEILKCSDLLLLSIPNVKDNEGVLTGKLFEYLASQKPILCIGPVNGNAASIINECEAGITVSNNDIENAYNFLKSKYTLWKDNGTTFLTSSHYQKYNRRKQAEQLEALILQ